MSPAFILQTEIERISFFRIVAQLMYILPHHPEIQDVQMTILVNVFHHKIIIGRCVYVRISIVVKGRQRIGDKPELKRIFGNVLEHTHRSQTVGEDVRLPVVVIVVKDHPVVQIRKTTGILRCILESIASAQEGKQPVTVLLKAQQIWNAIKIEINFRKMDRVQSTSPRDWQSVSVLNNRNRLLSFESEIIVCVLRFRKRKQHTEKQRQGKRRTVHDYRTRRRWPSRIKSLRKWLSFLIFETVVWYLAAILPKLSPLRTL